MGIAPALTSLMTSLPPELSLGEAGHELRRIAADIRMATPVGYTVKGYPGQGGRTRTPWVGVFDSDITDRPNVGLYVAYICRPDSSGVTLTLQQGSEALQNRVGAPEARRLLRARANWIRNHLGLESDSLLAGSFGPGKRQPSYEAGSVASQTYLLDALPHERALRAHLQSMLEILGSSVSALKTVRGAEWDGPEGFQPDLLPDSPAGGTFVPKDSGSYIVDLPASSQTKSRLHEKVVNDLASVQQASGWTATSEHPIDLVLRTTAGRTRMYIVEVKQVRNDNGVDVVRAAIGQLFTYRWQLFSEAVRETIGLIAAFSEDVGPSLRALMSNELGIAVLWLDGLVWHGCQRAEAEGLVPGDSIVAT